MRKFMTVMLGFLALMWIALPATAKVQININLSAERMHVTADNGETYDWRVSSARRGYITPDGNYRPQSLQVMHYSHKYHNAPMPHAIFFRGGYAIHGGYSAASMGVPRSHGCVRLTNDHAAILFALVRSEGANIHIYGQPPASIYARVHRPVAHRIYHIAYRNSYRRVAMIRHFRVRTVHYVRHEVRGHWYRRRVVAWRWKSERVVHFVMVRHVVHYVMVRHLGHVNRALAYAPAYHVAARHSVGFWQIHPLPAYLLSR